jgi:hypothetical protein
MTTLTKVVSYSRNILALQERHGWNDNGLMDLIRCRTVIGIQTFSDEELTHILREKTLQVAHDVSF